MIRKSDFCQHPPQDIDGAVDLGLIVENVGPKKVSLRQFFAGKEDLIYLY